MVAKHREKNITPGEMDRMHYNVVVPELEDAMVSRPPKNHPHLWTPREEAILIKYFRKVTRRDLCATLGVRPWTLEREIQDLRAAGRISP
jgi:hypothetical protein